MVGSPIPTAATVLLIDDDADVRALVRSALEREGYDVAEADGSRSAFRMLHELRPRLVVLSLVMPTSKGWRTLLRIREVSDVPVIVLGVRPLHWERVRWLRAGADDCISKPFSPLEVAARAEALLRRAGDDQDDGPGVYADGYLTVDFATRRVTAGDAPVSLTPLEFRLLSVLLDHREEVLGRDRLLELVWGRRGAVQPDQVRLYVAYLRRKLEAAAGTPPPIETVRGFGYMYRATDWHPAGTG